MGQVNLFELYRYYTFIQIMILGILSMPTEDNILKCLEFSGDNIKDCSIMAIEMFIFKIMISIFN